VDALRIRLDVAFLDAIGIQVNEDDLRILYHEIGSSLRQWIGGDDIVEIDAATTLNQWIR